MQTASIINDVGIPRHKQKTNKETDMTPPKLLRTVAFSILTFLFAVAMGVGTSFAQVYITPDGDNGNGDGTQANPYQTLLFAVGQADDGDTIFIGGGTYTTGGAVTITSSDSFTFSTYEHQGTEVATFTDNYEFDGGISITGNLADETLVFSGDVTLTDADLSFNGEYIDVVGDLTIASGSDFTATGSSFTPVSGNGNLDVDGTLTLGSGTLLRLADDLTVTGSGQIGVDGSISILSNTVTIGAGGATFAGDVTLNASGELALGANTLTLMGDFTNIEGSTFSQGTGTLSFAGGVDQQFFPRQLTVHNLSVTGSATNLIVRTTLRVDGDVDISANSTMELGQSGDAAVHVRLLANGTFDNQGEYSSPTNVNGFIIAESNYNLEGDGVYGNINARNSTITVNAGGINVSGKVLVEDDQTIAGADITFTDDDVAVSTVTINGGDITANLGVSGDALYDLIIDADAAINVANELMDGVRNVTLGSQSSTVGYTVTAGADVEIAGTLTIDDDMVLADNGADIELSGNNLTHSIVGNITGSGALVVTGSGVAVNGSGTDQSEIFGLTVNTSGSFSSTGLIEINGNVTNTAGSSSITFSASNSAGTEIAGNVTATAGSLSLTHAGSPASNGSLTPTTINIGGNVTIAAGNLTVNDATSVAGTTSQASGNLNMGSNSYTATGAYTRTGTGTVTNSGSGYLRINAGFDNDSNNTNDFSIANLAVDGVSTIVTNQDGALDQTFTVTGKLSVGANLTLGAAGGELVKLILDSGDYTQAAAASVLNGSGGTDFSWIRFANGVEAKLNAAPTFDRIEIAGNVNFVQGGTSSTNEQTITVNDLWLHSSGAVNLGAGRNNTGDADNTLTVAGDFNFVSGSYSADEGVININGGALDVEGNVSFPRASFGAATTVTDEGTITITKSGHFDGALSGLVDDQLSFGNGIDITVSTTGANPITSEDIVLGTGMSYTYDGGGAVTAGTELASTVDDFELTTGSDLTLPSAFGDFTVTGTLTLDANLTTSNNDLVFAETSSIVDDANGAVTLGTGDYDFPDDGIVSLTLGKAGDINTSAFFTTNSIEVDVEELIVGAAVTIDNSGSAAGTGYTLSSDVTVNTGHSLTLTSPADGANASPIFTVGGDLELKTTGSLSLDGGANNGYQLAIQGGFSADVNGGNTANITHATAAGNATPRISFTGSSNGNITITDSNNGTTNTWQPAVALVINKSGSGVVTLNGNNLEPLIANGGLVLTDGVLATSSSAVVILEHDDFEDGVSDQGFSRTSGVIAGNVRKAIPADIATTGTLASEYSRVVFPTGNSSGEYRPLIYNFDSDDDVQGYNLTVSHVNSNPMGVQGLPAGAAVKYPDFHWTVESDLLTSLGSSYTYSVQAEAEGYDIDDLGFTMNDVTLIRRAAGSASTNQWNQTATNYDNELTPGDLPIVRGLNTSQLIRTQKRLLTFGLPSTLREENAIADAKMNVNQVREFDMSNIFEGETGGIKYTVSSGDTDVVSVDSLNSTNAELFLKGMGVGTATITISAEDSTDDVATSTFDLTVSPQLMASESFNAVQYANLDQDYKVDLYNWFAGGTDSLVFSVSNEYDSVSVPSIVGAENDSLEISLEKVGRDTIYVQAIDTAAVDTLNLQFELNISSGFAAVGSIDDQTLHAADSTNQAAQSFVVDTLSSFFTTGSGQLTYTAMSSASDTASVSMSSDTLTVTAVASSANVSPVTITVTATDASGASVNQTFEVTVAPAFGDVLVDGEVTTLDARQILGAAIGEEDFTAVQNLSGDVNQDGNVNAFDASITFRYSLGSVENLPFSSSSKVSPAILAYGEANVEEGFVRVPLNVEGSDIVSVDFDGSFNANAATLESLDLTNLPDDWMVVESTTKEGTVKFALAGTTPISEGQLATLTFKLKDDNSKVGLTAKGFANNSEYSLDEFIVDEKPQSFALEQNYPNPFNPTTNVRYQLPASADVTVELFTISGQKVQTLVNTRQNAGVYTLNVDGSRLASGVYIYRIVAKADNQTFTTTKKMTLIK